MKKKDLMEMAYTAEVSTGHYQTMAAKVAETIGKLLEVLANTDPLACKSLLGEINAQMTPAMLDESIAMHTEHKESELLKGMHEMGEGNSLHFEEEGEKEDERTKRESDV